ncbi:Loader and inhibitor of phage G40P [Geobacillus sp. 12AMOR1]|nr:Loader and inhibitor of phage G40P [Geobacillus sp. 12AMOR1]
MTKKETALLLQEIAFLYPTVFAIEPDKLPAMTEAWNKVLGRQGYEETLERLYRYASENKRPPTIADLYIRRHAAYDSDVLEQMKQWEREAVGHKR